MNLVISEILLTLKSSSCVNLVISEILLTLKSSSCVNLVICRQVALLTSPEGKSKGAAFVTYAYTENAQQAVQQLNGYVFPNSTRPINVSFATKQTFGKNIPSLSQGQAKNFSINKSLFLNLRRILILNF